MSYRRTRRALAGVASHAPGRSVSRSAMGAVLLEVQPRHRPIYSSGPVPSWYRAMQGTTLGDDSLDAMNADAQWKADMLAGQRELIKAQRQWAEGDKFQKWIQIGVTASIPLFGALWRALGIGRRKK